MTIKSTHSTFAFVAATTLMLGSTAFAQTTVGDQDVTEADLPQVTAHCEMLAAEGGLATTMDPAPENEAVDDTAGGSTLSTDGDAIGVGTVDLEEITLQDCESAGLAPL